MGCPGTPTDAFSSPGVGAAEKIEKFVMNRLFLSPCDVPKARLAGLSRPSAAVASTVMEPWRVKTEERVLRVHGHVGVPEDVECESVGPEQRRSLRDD